MSQQATALFPALQDAPGPAKAGRPKTGQLTRALLEARGIPALAGRPLATLLGLDVLDQLYCLVKDSSSAGELAERTLQALDIRVEADFAGVVADGPLVIVANHPFGLLEGLVLMAHLGRVRPDVRILANDVLQHLARLPALHMLKDRLLPVDVAQTAEAAGNLPGLRAGLRHLDKGGALVLFPAGTVSHWQKGQGICDPAWKDTALRLAQRSRARVIPLFFEGRNSLAFSLAGLIHPSLRTLLLPGQLLNKRGCTVRVRAGSVLETDSLGSLPSTALRTDYLRMSCYALRDRQQSSRPKIHREPVATHAPSSLVEAALADLPVESLLASQGDYQVHVFRGTDSRLLLEEIGTAREETFRPCGEGTGRARDLDRHDRQYYHLLLWHCKDRALAGAYRLGLVPEILAEQGLDGLYCASLFKMDGRFVQHFGQQGLELGRALVTAPYQRDFYPLLLLWKGIATFIARHNLRYLFGPASLSLAASRTSLDLITTLLASQYASPELEGLVQGRHKPAPRRRDRAESAVLAAIRKGDIDFRGVDKMVRSLEGGRGIPVLFRHYLQLDGKIAAFHCDLAFNTLDAFLFVDLPKAPLAKLRRYMGDAEAAAYLECLGF